MKKILRNIYVILRNFGIDPRRAFYAVKALPRYFSDFRLLKKQQVSSNLEFPVERIYPFLGEKDEESGSARGHYFHQDLLVARRVHGNNPAIHIDVGSRIDGFVAHVASFRSIEVIDIRPNHSEIKNIKFRQADMMGPVGDGLADSCDSLSCLHAMEHFGLGRYGDPINYEGYLMGVENLDRVLRKGGKLYFSVPIGPQRIEFNAHRVFSVVNLLGLFREKYRLDCFSYVDDEGLLHEDVVLSDELIERNFGCFYGCGILELTKL